MRDVDVVVVGAGQAGLAVSWALGDLGVDHVVLERGTVADRWRARGRESLTLLTPRELSRVAGRPWGPGADPAGYPSRADVVSYLSRWAAAAGTPVRSGVTVVAVRRDGDDLVVETTTGGWRARAVVLATGHCARPWVPPAASSAAPWLHQVTADTYRRPAALPDGAVLVVGAGASGVQVADELADAGRDVVLAVSGHTRLPRHYRGRDVLAWLADAGALGRPRETLPDPDRPPHEPSMQLVGRTGHDVDLRSLQDRGVELTGRLVAADGAHLRFAPDLTLSCRRADDRARATLRRIDALADTLGAPHEDRPVLPARTVDAVAALDAGRRGIRSVVWATGYRRDDPVLPRGAAVWPPPWAERRAAVPGLFVVGVPWQSRRDSATLGGVGPDAADVARAVVGHLAAAAGSAGSAGFARSGARPASAAPSPAALATGAS